MLKSRWGRAALLPLAITGLTVVPAAAYGPPPAMNAAELEMALKKLNVLGNALFVAAHPDDENTAFLTWLENEKLVRAAYISMTRGDGGQNLIGDEKGDLLGVIRTQELLAARRIDGAEQFFSRAIDFGYSKTPDETLNFWGRDPVLADMVRVIRTYRPDVIITRFPTTGEGGHGHHTASAVLAVEAFEKAADPAYELDGLPVWKTERIFWNRFSWGGTPKPEEMTDLLTVDLGTYNPVLAKSYTELAADSRSMHRSQGFGSAERRGTMLNYLKPLGGSPAKTDPFEGIDLTWSRIPGGRNVGELLARAEREFDPRSPEATLPLLLQARKGIEALRNGNSATPAMAGLLDHKLREIDEVIRSSAGLWLEAIANQAEFIPGDSLKVSATAVNRSDVPLRLVKVSGPGSVTADVAKPLGVNTPVTIDIKFPIPADFDVMATQPYWLRRDHRAGAFTSPGRFTVTDPALIGTPENEPLFNVTFTVETNVPEANGGSHQTIDYTIPVIYRWTDRVEGEQYRPVVVVPEVSLELDQKVYLFPDTSPREVRVQVTGRRPTSGRLHLNVTGSTGWRLPAPETVTLDGSVPQTVTFTLAPPDTASVADISVEFVSADRRYEHDVVTIDYDHIPRQTILQDAAARVVRLDVKRRGDRVAYIMGPGDEIPDNLRQTGYEVHLLSDSDIESGDLSGYDAIVMGVRAYNTRDALKRRQDRILKYVENGGTVIVQYNTADNTLFPTFAPYSLKLGRERVTVEEAPITFVDPKSPLLNFPNAITSADFEGWVQERGLYFASEWDSTNFRPVLASADPGGKELTGGLLEARYGKGVFIYTGYAFFRQLPAGVPGAYRLFVNLVSAK